jgi:hypothetical protein
LNNKELPPFIGEAKVREFDNRKNFEAEIFVCFQPLVNIFFSLWKYVNKKPRRSGAFN